MSFRQVERDATSRREPHQLHPDLHRQHFHEFCKAHSEHERHPKYRQEHCHALPEQLRMADFLVLMWLVVSCLLQATRRCDCLSSPRVVFLSQVFCSLPLHGSHGRRDCP